MAGHHRTQTTLVVETYLQTANKPSIPGTLMVLTGLKINMLDWDSPSVPDSAISRRPGSEVQSKRSCVTLDRGKSRELNPCRRAGERVDCPAGPRFGNVTSALAVEDDNRMSKGERKFSYRELATIRLHQTNVSFGVVRMLGHGWLVFGWKSSEHQPTIRERHKGVLAPGAQTANLWEAWAHQSFGLQLSRHLLITGAAAEFNTGENEGFKTAFETTELKGVFIRRSDKDKIPYLRQAP
ncbi:hypothetical protein Bbelb_032560 [Branchiostoma belcheri]|nr:hypothetical protein Bbelb_032560 [Branchiostoma belcheri]